MVAALVCGAARSTAFAIRPTCVDGFPDDCAYLAAAEAYAANPTAKARRDLRRIARRGHVGARAVLLTSDDPSGKALNDAVAGLEALANRGVPAGFEGLGLALINDPSSMERGRDLLLQAMRRGPRDAIATLAVGALDYRETPEAELRIAESLLVAACVMGSEFACYRAAYDSWEPESARHEPELARWLAERALALGSESAPKLLGLMLLSGEPDKAELDRAISLLLPHAEAKDGHAMYLVAMAYFRRGTGDDTTVSVQWLGSAVDAGYVDAAFTVVGLALSEESRMSAAGLTHALTDRSLAMLEQERPEAYALYALVSAKPWFGASERPQRVADVDPLVAGLSAAHRGSAEALGMLAAHVIAEPDSVQDPAGFLARVQDTLCAVGPQGVPHFVHMVRTLGNPMDLATQAAWLFFVRDQEPWSPARPLEFVSVRDQVWSELSGADLVAAEARAVRMREEIRAANPGCALVR
jgi:TPR repeat protein